MTDTVSTTATTTPSSLRFQIAMNAAGDETTIFDMNDYLQGESEESSEGESGESGDDVEADDVAPPTDEIETTQNNNTATTTTTTATKTVTSTTTTAAAAAEPNFPMVKHLFLSMQIQNIT